MKIATITRTHVYGTPNFTLDLHYNGRNITPRERDHNGHKTRGPAWIADTQEGIDQLKAVAREAGFTHVRLNGFVNQQKVQSLAKPFPKLEKDVQIEVPAPRNGRPGYRWAQGWIVRYAEHRTSMPMRLMEARNEYARAVREARGI